MMLRSDNDCQTSLLACTMYKPHLRLLTDRTPQPGFRRDHMPPSGESWLGSSVGMVEGAMSDVVSYIPQFDRHPFRVTTGLIAITAENPHYDVIVRQPIDGTFKDVPIAIVSKNYALVQHREVAECARNALHENGIDADALAWSLRLTTLGERMELRINLPPTYDFDPGDDFPLGLQLYFINSVDGSTKLSFAVGWLRFVCNNGLIVGTTSARMHQIHNPRLDVDLITAHLRQGLRLATRERDVLKEWITKRIKHEVFKHWTNTRLMKKWGVKAATRTFNIVLTTKDVRLTNPFETLPAAERSVEYTREVPGIPVDHISMYSVSQALAWLARDRRDVEQRRRWLLDIPRLMKDFG